MTEAAEAAEDGVELDAEEGRRCSDWRCDEAECGERCVSASASRMRMKLGARDEDVEARPVYVSSKTGARESKRSGDPRSRGESRATSSRKAASFLSHMPSSTLSTGTEGLSRDWMLLKRCRMLPHLGVLVMEGELGDDVDVDVDEDEAEAEAKLMPATPRPAPPALNVAEDSSSGDFMISMVSVLLYVGSDAAWASRACQSQGKKCAVQQSSFGLTREV